MIGGTIFGELSVDYHYHVLSQPFSIITIAHPPTTFDHTLPHTFFRSPDFNPETGGLQVRSGKGDKDRLVYLPQGALSYLSKWLAVRGRQPGALLCPIRKGGEIEYRNMTAQAVLLIVQKRAKDAGVESFSPHDFRRTFCSDLLDAGVDIVTVQKLAGHASPVTTAKYDRRGEETKRKAVQNLGF